MKAIIFNIEFLTLFLFLVPFSSYVFRLEAASSRNFQNLFSPNFGHYSSFCSVFLDLFFCLPVATSGQKTPCDGTPVPELYGTVENRPCADLQPPQVEK